MDVRTELAVYRGGDGTPATWSQLMAAVAEADVIIVGEEHGNAVGHRVELAIVQDVLDRWPGSALSMEMLDRTEQAVVDDYLADFIDLETFQERTASTRWLKISKEYVSREINRKTFEKRITRLGWPQWETNYQPIIDAARSAGAPVIAANTPWLVYSSVARRDGFERLQDVTSAQRALFDVPAQMPQGNKYRERFWDVMVGRAEGEPPPDDDDADEDDEDGEPAHTGLDDETVAAIFRGQLVMDATMAASIATASKAGAPKVIHLVGHFHCDFEGGLVQELRRRLPGAEILVITALSQDEPTLRDEDVDRADFVVYTKR